MRFEQKALMQNKQKVNATVNISLPPHFYFVPLQFLLRHPADLVVVKKKK